MTWTSTVPAVLAALVDGFSTALPDVLVVDSYVVSGTNANVALLVCAATDDEPGVVDQQFETVGVRGGQTRETYTVRCEARALDTTTNLTAARTNVYALLAAAGAYLISDPTLGRLVNSAQLGTASLAAAQDKSGALAALAFGIDVDAFIQ